MVMFALTLSALLAVTGLLFTFGLVLEQRRSLQNAADAASLRGSWQVLQQLAADDRSDTHVLNAITPFAAYNGLPADGTFSAYYVDAYGKQLCPVVKVGVGRASDGTVPLNARGVQVLLQNNVSTFLDRFLSGWQGKATVDNRTLTTAANAIATARPVATASMTLVVPLAINETALKAALNDSSATLHPVYDLFASSVTLDLSTAAAVASGFVPANRWGDLAPSEQAWSDGAHLGAWAMGQPGTVSVAVANADLTHPANAAYHWEIATGLAFNDTRQKNAGAAHGLVMVPVYRDATSPPQISGFAQFMIASITNDNLTAAKVMGRYVPYAVTPYGPVLPFAASTCGAPGVAVPDFGAAQVSLVS
jgi:Putative Flp pilus-assembly TadE/G-like